MSNKIALNLASVTEELTSVEIAELTEIEASSVVGGRFFDTNEFADFMSV